MIFYEEVAINKELVWFPLSPFCQYKQWITKAWEKILHKHCKIVKIKRLDDPDQLSKGNVPRGTNPEYCPSYFMGPMLGIYLIHEVEHLKNIHKLNMFSN